MAWLLLVAGIVATLGANAAQVPVTDRWGSW